MLRSPAIRTLAVLVVLLASALASAQGQNMIGRQSQNEGIPVLPAPTQVVIDGDLKDWDWSGRIWVFADSSLRERFSVEVAAMYDRENLYLAAKWKDPTPMFNAVDPVINPHDGWKSDSMQVRLRTDRITHLTTWYYTAKEMPVVDVAYGKSLTAPFGGDGGFVAFKEHDTHLGHGLEMAYKMDADGKGYVQEMKIPWSVIYEKAPDFRAGDTFQMGFEFLWGDSTGKAWPIHRYADNMQPGMTSREFYFTNYKAWGTAQLMGGGGVPVRQYAEAVTRMAGTIPIRVQLPREASRFTIAIDDQQGRRVRNLAGGFDPQGYLVATRGKEITVEVLWDGLDDHGKLVAPGAYKVRGLTQNGLGAEYEMCYYNPGTPPWPTPKGTGAWGADHSGPMAVASAGDLTFITCPIVEGGSGVWAIHANGRKIWEERRGAERVAANKTYVYAVGPNGFQANSLCLYRYATMDGSYQNFVLDGKPRTFDLPLEEVLGPASPPAPEGDAAAAAQAKPTGRQVTGMAVHDNKLVLALSDGKLAVLDAASAAVVKRIDAPRVGSIAFDKEGKLYAVLDGKLVEMNLDTGAATSIATPELGLAGAIAVDLDGNIVVADRGPDSQVKAFSPAGKQVYSAGKKGGRAIRGPFNPQAMIAMSSVAVDAKGEVWVVEQWQYPRRVSVWDRDGELVRDYIGNTNYAGTSCYLHEQNPALAYCGPMEFRLDKKKNQWMLTQILWVPDPSKGEDFPIQTGSNVMPARFTSSASGTPHEYLYVHDGREGGGQVVYMETNGYWQPVAAITTMGHITSLGAEVTHPPPKVKKGKKPGVVLPPSTPVAPAPTPAPEAANDAKPAYDANDACFWNDLNGDGRVQIEECTIIPAADLKNPEKPWAKPFSLENGWGGRIAPDLTIYTDGITRYHPIGFSPEGAPRYGPGGAKDMGVDERGDLVPDPANRQLLCLSFKGYSRATTGMLGIDEATGQIKWSYPNLYPGVHGSHNAPMPRPGLLIGPNKILGLVHVNDQVGNVFALRSNLGQDFFMTADGLYVGAMFQDCRFPAQGLPDTEEKLRGAPMEAYSEGGEPFNGWFGKQSDGKIRLTTGMPRQACMILQIHGLESIKRFDGPGITLGSAELVKADKDNNARLKPDTELKAYAIRATAKPPTLTGNAGEWAGPPMEIAREGQTEHAQAWLSHDAENLYARFEVWDASPWKNDGKEASRLFKTGDAVDLQLGPDVGGKPHAAPMAGDVRVIIANMGGKPVAVLMAPVDKTAPAVLRQLYSSPVGKKLFDRVEVLSAAKVNVKVEGDRYVVEASIPLKDLGVTLKAAMKIHGDVGFISSDAQGTINVARTYWANPATNLVNDLPLEAWLYTQSWGDWTLE